MTFAAFPYVFGLVLVPLLLLLGLYGLRRKREALAVFANSDSVGGLVAGYGGLRPWLASVLLALAGALLVLALMQPQWGLDQSDVGRRGRDVLVMLDVSLSMLAEDARPNRLEAAKAGIRALVAQVRGEGGHRLGLIAFAGRASMLCPLTLDYSFFLQRLDEARTESVPRSGTLIGDALRQALQGFGELDYGHTDVILLSDGDDHDSVPMEAARIAKALGSTLHAVGIGDHAEGAPIPMPDEDGSVQFIQHRGEEVMSRLGQDLLTQLAQTSGGIYVAAGTGEVLLDRLYTDRIQTEEYRFLDDSGGERRAHRYAWFVLPAVLLLMLEMILPWWRRPREANA